MKIEINLDETRFKDLVDNELEKFTDAEIHDILSKALSQFVVENNVIASLFYKKKTDWCGNETGEFEPTYRLQKLIDNLDVSEQTEKLKENIDKVLQEDDIIQKLVEGMFYRLIAGRLRDVIWDATSLQQLIELKANKVVDWRKRDEQ